MGIETSAAQAKFVREKLNLPVYCGTVQEFSGSDERYDVTHMAHTLEHTPDPKSTLRELMTVTKPNGIIFVEVPNVRSLKNLWDHYCTNFGIRKNTWKVGDFPEHLVEFTPKTLFKLIESVGLTPLTFQCHSRSAVKHGGLRRKVDAFANRLVSAGNNLIVVARNR